jgi:hypothetical protein
MAGTDRPYYLLSIIQFIDGIGDVFYRRGLFHEDPGARIQGLTPAALIASDEDDFRAGLDDQHRPPML